MKVQYQRIEKFQRDLSQRNPSSFKENKEKNDEEEFKDRSVGHKAGKLGEDLKASIQTLESMVKISREEIKAQSTELYTRMSCIPGGPLVANGPNLKRYKKKTLTNRFNMSDIAKYDGNTNPRSTYFSSL